MEKIKIGVWCIKRMMLALLLASLPGLCLSESDVDRPAELSAAQIKSLQQAGSAILAARVNATEDPGIRQLRNDMQTLRQTLEILSRPAVVGGDIHEQATVGPAGVVQSQSSTQVQARRDADKQRVRDAMVQVRQRHAQLRQKSPTRGPIPQNDAMMAVTNRLTVLQADIDSALVKPDKEMRAACKALLERVEPRHLMIAQPLEGQPTLSTRIRHRR